MRRHITMLVTALFVVSLPVFAQGILPGAFADWTAGTKGSFNPAQAEGAGASAADAAKEYEFVAGEQISYTRGAESIGVTLYRLKDPSDAYGEYSFLRTLDMPHSDLADHAAMSRDRALVLTGNLVLDIHGNDLAKLQASLKTLIAEVSMHAEVGPLPLLWQHLPTDNIVERSDHYILGPITLNQFFPLGVDDWLGFSHGAEAETARYKIGGNDLTLLVADFPTPQLASDELARLEKRFNLNGSTAAPNSPRLFGKRTVTMLEIVMGAPTRDAANTLLKQIESGTVVTWNEPTFQFKEPSIEMMIVGSIVGTGLICVFTLVAGVAFGGFRLAMKRVFPNKVFDRSEQIQVLQLGLSSKPINAEDFYGLDASPTPTATVDKNLPDRVALRIFR